MKYKITMPSGLVFDFTNMFGENRLQQDEVAQAIAECGSRADAAVGSIRAEGVAKNHLSKDGTPEHVYFTRMPYVAEGNPNTEASIIKLLKYSKALRQQDVVVFLGVGGSYLGNKVLFDAFGIPTARCVRVSRAFIFPVIIWTRWTATVCCTRWNVWLPDMRSAGKS